MKNGFIIKLGHRRGGKPAFIGLAPGEEVKPDEPLTISIKNTLEDAAEYPFPTLEDAEAVVFSLDPEHETKNTTYEVMSLGPLPQTTEMSAVN